MRRRITVRILTPMPAVPVPRMLHPHATVYTARQQTHPWQCLRNGGGDSRPGSTGARSTLRSSHERLPGARNPGHPHWQLLSIRSAI